MILPRSFLRLERSSCEGNVDSSATIALSALAESPESKVDDDYYCWQLWRDKKSRSTSQHLRYHLRRLVAKITKDRVAMLLGGPVV